MKGDGYYGTITVLPDGRVYTGQHENSVPENQKLYAKSRRPSIGLAGKINLGTVTTVQDRTNALLARIVKENLSLAAATTIAQSENITHLQLVRLFEAAQGVPDVYFHIDNMYVHRDIPQLEFRETFYDTTQDVEFLDRMEESRSTQTNYDEIKYDLKKLVGKTYNPIEDIIRTIINPQQVDQSQIDWGMKRRRNQEGINQLANIANTQITLDSPADIGANFHSTNNTGNDLLELFKTFLIEEDVSIDHVAMSPTMYANYTSNTWTENGGPNGMYPMRLPSGGVVPFPGIPGITAVIDPMITNDDVMFAINKANALRLGQGPVIMRRYYDEERDSEVVKKLDFVQYIAVKSQLTKLTRDFGMTIPFNAPV
jgi:hypothetical protein